MKTLALIVPCFNEEEVLPLFYRETGKVLAALSSSYKYELVFIDDGSTDGTLSVIKGFAEQNPSVKYISFSRNFGKEAAMYAGMEYAVRFDYIGILDADLQHSPELLPEMLNYVDAEGYDVAAAKRSDRAGESSLKSKLSVSFYKFINRISETKISESAQDFRIMRTKVVEAVLEMPERIRFTKGIFSWVGFNVKWIEHENRERAAGKTKWSLKKLFGYAIDGILGFTNSPLKLGFLFSALFFLGSVAALVFEIVKNVIDADYIGTVPILLCAVFFTASVLMLFLGILGEYLGRIYTEAKKRPVYIVSKTNIDDKKENSK